MEGDVAPAEFSVSGEDISVLFLLHDAQFSLSIKNAIQFYSPMSPMNALET
jgi:hypothetical protein